MQNIDKLEEIPRELDTEFFRELFKSAEISNFTPSEKRKYRKDMMDKQSIAMGIKFQRRVGREEGLAEGRAEGLAEGRAESRLAIARLMLANGCDSALVIKCTGLSEEELEKLN